MATLVTPVAKRGYADPIGIPATLSLVALVVPTCVTILGISAPSATIATLTSVGMGLSFTALWLLTWGKRK